MNGKWNSILAIVLLATVLSDLPPYVEAGTFRPSSGPRLRQQARTPAPATEGLGKLEFREIDFIIKCKFIYIRCSFAITISRSGSTAGDYGDLDWTESGQHTGGVTVRWVFGFVLVSKPPSLARFEVFCPDAESAGRSPTGVLEVVVVIH